MRIKKYDEVGHEGLYKVSFKTERFRPELRSEAKPKRKWTLGVEQQAQIKFLPFDFHRKETVHKDFSSKRKPSQAEFGVSED